jgi:O-6-methylguanine DNA methyltransferase
MQKKFLKKQTTSFQSKVYKVVSKILKGKVLTYRKVANLAGHPRAWRAVGNILNKNRNPKVPCHRVIRSDGKIGGFNKGTKRKACLLKKEGVVIKNRGNVLCQFQKR